MSRIIGYIERPKEDDNKYLYVLVTGKSGRGWVYPLDHTHPADYIYCTDSKDWNKKGEGFGGSTLTFPILISNGIDEDWVEEFLLHGGWHSNSHSLLSDTGIDITDKYFTRVVISLKRESSVDIWPHTYMDEIIHEDSGWVLGDYKRGDELAKKFANELGVPVYCWIQSIGGGSMGWVQPDTVSE